MLLEQTERGEQLMENKFKTCVKLLMENKLQNVFQTINGQQPLNVFQNEEIQVQSLAPFLCLHQPGVGEVDAALKKGTARHFPQGISVRWETVMTQTASCSQLMRH